MIEEVPRVIVKNINIKPSARGDIHLSIAYGFSKTQLIE